MINTKNNAWRRSIQGLFFVSLLIACHAEADESQLIIHIQGVRESIGEIRTSLYREPDSFRKEDQALKVISLPASQGENKVILDGLAPGRYAAMVYHDENSDQKLNLRFGMFPTEGYGLSNNPKVMGPPKFSDSAFEITGAETSIDIKLVY